MSFLKISVAEQQEFLNFFSKRNIQEQNQFLELLLIQLKAILRLKKTDLAFLENLLQKQLESQALLKLDTQIQGL